MEQFIEHSAAFLWCVDHGRYIGGHPFGGLVMSCLKCLQQIEQLLTFLISLCDLMTFAESAV